MVFFFIVVDVIVSGNTVVVVDIFTVDVVGVSIVDVRFSIVVILLVVDIFSLDEVVFSDNVVILLVVVEVDGNKYSVLLILQLCSFRQQEEEKTTTLHNKT